MAASRTLNINIKQLVSQLMPGSCVLLKDSFCNIIEQQSTRLVKYFYDRKIGGGCI